MTIFAGSSKILFGFLGLLIAALLQVKLMPVFGFYPNFVLAALIVLAYFWNQPQMILWSFIGVVFLGWRYFFSAETALIFLIPQLIFLVKKIFPWQSWISNFASILAGLIVFDLVAGPFLFVENYSVALKDALAMLVFGGIFFQLMRLPSSK